MNDNQQSFSCEELQSAIADGQFEMWYQPKICLTNYAVDGFEALIRWNHPSLGVLEPGKFLASVDSEGMMDVLNRFVILSVFRKSCLLKKENKSIPISLNLELKYLEDPDTFELFQNARTNFGVQENYIEIELLENSSIEFNDSFEDRMMELRNLGYKISIDDFGKGNSNIYHLINIPITTIKLDRLFSSGVVNVKIKELLKTVIKMANILGLDVVAEGIENEEHLSMFKELGCHLGQGYFLGHPSRLMK